MTEHDDVEPDQSDPPTDAPTAAEDSLVTVDCTECHFSRVVSTDGDELPAEVLIRHGEKTGHKVAIETEGPDDRGEEGRGERQDPSSDPV